MITISLRTYNSHIKSLLHFNYPYFAESGDGLTDEIGSFSWVRSATAKLAGSEIPADVIISGTPKFGYRCLHSTGSSDYITGTASAAMTLTQLECSFWLRPTSSSAGTIFQLKSSSTAILSLSITAESKLTASSSTLGLNFTDNTALTVNTWYYVRLQVSATSANLSVNNSAGTSATPTASLPAFNTIQLGGFSGQLDEFILRDSFTSDLPAEPVKATIRVNTLGGFGTGALGNVTLTANCVMNTCGAFIGSIANPSGYSVTNIREGKFGAFKSGDEVMLLNTATGEYCFMNITSISGSYYKFSSAIPDSFKTDGGLQMIQIPNFNTLTINSGVTVSPQNWDELSGGIVAFRVKGNCTVNGSIITSGKGRPRTDSLQLTHSKLVDNFIMNLGGGIFITCGGTFTAGSAARLGATWDGSAKGGQPVSQSKGGNGGAGYGGAGGSDSDQAGIGGKGGVGGGGGGGNAGTGQDAGAGTATGGAGYDGATEGGTQGVTEGGNSKTANIHHATSGGAGAGGNSANIINSGLRGAYSGTNLVLIANTLKTDAAAISTGGEGGQMDLYATGGGGTGFCYIACERMV